MMTIETTGSLSVLNVGAGDIEIAFNNHDKDETKKAIMMLSDMQKRGYAVLVKDADGAYQRALSIDATRGRYILMLPGDMALPADAEPETCACGCGKKVSPGKTWVKGHARKGRKGTRKVSVPIKGRHAVGVARSAGG